MVACYKCGPFADIHGKLGMIPTWSIAVFAHNEANGIAATLRSIDVAAQGTEARVFVLVNGCRDHTATIARALALASVQLQVVEIPLADKSNAWNLYLHTIAATPQTDSARLHAFIDGDVLIEPDSLHALAAAFEEVPTANAAGALPSSGRDRDAWCRRMVANGTLAGGLYALRGDFVERIRKRNIRIPLGFIGDDWLVSLWAKSDLNPLVAATPLAPRVVFANQAGFSFRSLSPWRPGDYRIYGRRLWRYALRGVQFEMVLGWLWHQLPESLPHDVEQLYQLALPPSRLKWVGWSSVLRFLAVQNIRNLRERLWH